MGTATTTTSDTDEHLPLPQEGLFNAQRIQKLKPRDAALASEVVLLTLAHHLHQQGPVAVTHADQQQPDQPQQPEINAVRSCHTTVLLQRLGFLNTEALLQGRRKVRTDATCREPHEFRHQPGGSQSQRQGHQPTSQETAQGLAFNRPALISSRHARRGQRCVLQRRNKPGADKQLVTIRFATGATRSPRTWPHLCQAHPQP